MKRIHLAPWVGALALAVTACATGVRAPQHYYVLDPLPSAAPVMPNGATRADAATMLVAPTTTTGFYDAQAIAYSRSPDTRAYYQLNSWTEPPSRRLGVLLTERLMRSGAFGNVALATHGVHGQLLLTTHLEEIYHDASTPPGTARIALVAELSDPARRSITDQRRFTASAPAATYDAAGAVQGFDAALGPLLDEVVAWAAEASASGRSPPDELKVPLAASGRDSARPTPR
jgi:cholesterol transport system auxiliary component